MTTTETILGGLLISIIAGVIGNQVGQHDKVGSKTCEERREACRCFLAEQITSIKKSLEDLIKIVNEKLLGL